MCSPWNKGGRGADEGNPPQFGGNEGVLAVNPKAENFQRFQKFR